MEDLQQVPTTPTHEAPGDPATRPARTGLGLFAASAAFLLPVAYSPSLNSPFWSLRLVMTLVVAAVGLPRLAFLVRSADRAAVSAVAFLAVAAVSTLAARYPSMAMLGSYGFGGGLAMVAGIVGAWAIGRSIDGRGRADVQSAILAGLLVNIFVALAQEAFDLRSLGLNPTRGAFGLLGNPVHLGALLAGGIALVAGRFSRRPWRWAAAVVAAGAALQMSGSRFGMLSLAVVTACVVRNWPLLRIGLFAACLAAGFTGAFVAQPSTGGNSVTVVQKLQSAGEGELYNRVQNWRSGVQALVDRPALGYGPGRFHEATSPRRTARMAKGDPETIFLDAHNIFVEYLVTTGPLGLLALCAFLGLAARAARGPLLWCALGILALHLVQPQSFGTTPVAFLALGAAGPASLARRSGRTLPAVTGALVLSAALAATRLVLGDFRLDQANLDFSITQGRAAAGALLLWPEPAAKLGQIYYFHSTVADPTNGRGELESQALGWSREAVNRDPALATGWNNLGDIGLVLGNEDEARSTFTEALAWNPWSARALTALAAIALRDGDTAAAQALTERANRVLAPDLVRDLIEKRGGRR